VFHVAGGKFGTLHLISLGGAKLTMYVCVCVCILFHYRLL